MEFSPEFMSCLVMSVAGFIFGYMRGFRSGILYGTDGLVRHLTDRGFLVVRKNIRGEEHFITITIVLLTVLRIGPPAMLVGQMGMPGLAGECGYDILEIQVAALSRSTLLARTLVRAGTVLITGHGQMS